jgi:hypothetical protein
MFRLWIVICIVAMAMCDGCSSAPKEGDTMVPLYLPKVKYAEDP